MYVCTTCIADIQWNGTSLISVIVSEVSSFQRLKCIMHARVVLGVGKGVLSREVSSVQECPHRKREREVPLHCTCLHTVSLTTLGCIDYCLYNLCMYV